MDFNILSWQVNLLRAFRNQPCLVPTSERRMSKLAVSTSWTMTISSISMLTLRPLRCNHLHSEARALMSQEITEIITPGWKAGNHIMHVELL